MEKYKGYKFNKNTVINKFKSTNPLAKLSYKKLKKVALQLHLPTNLQHKLLLAMVIAKKEGRDDIVKLIVKTQQKRNRKRLLATNLGNDSCETQQLPSTITSSSVCQFQINSCASTIPDSSNLKKYSSNLENYSSNLVNYFTEPDYNPMSSGITTEVLTDSQEANNCVDAGISCVNALNMYSPVPVDRMTVDNIQHPFATPSSGLDSGFCSFTSLDYSFENDGISDIQTLLQDDPCDVGANDPKINNDPTELSIVDVLETLSENQ